MIWPTPALASCGKGRTDANDGNATAEVGSSGRETKSRFEEQLDKLEAVLSQNGGPFIMGCASLLPHLGFAPCS